MFCTTDIIAVSESLKSKIVELKLAKSNKIKFWVTVVQMV